MWSASERKCLLVPKLTLKRDLKLVPKAELNNESPLDYVYVSSSPPPPAPPPYYLYGPWLCLSLSEFGRKNRSNFPTILLEVMYLKNLITDSQFWREDAPNDFPLKADSSPKGTLKMSTALARG